MTYPKCRYCYRPVLLRPDDHYLADRDRGIDWPETLCGLHIDLEFCCNVSKDAWGTKRLARFVALDYGMTDVVEELDSRELEQAGI